LAPARHEHQPPLRIADIIVEEAVPHPHLGGERQVRRDQPRCSGKRASRYSMMPVASNTNWPSSTTTGKRWIRQSAANSLATGSEPSIIFDSNRMPFSYAFCT